MTKDGNHFRLKVEAYGCEKRKKAEMKKYAFMVINYSGSFAGQKGVNLYCTDPHTIDWLLEEVRRYAAGTKARYGRKALDGTLNFIQLNQLRGNDYAIAHRMFRRACEEGWEPRDVTTPGHKTFYKFDGITFKLRKVYQD